MAVVLSRDARGAVVLALRGPLALEDRAVAVRAVERELLRPAALVVLDLGPIRLAPTTLGTVVSTAIRIAAVCEEAGVGCAVVSRDRALLARAFAMGAPGRPVPLLASTPAAALATVPALPDRRSPAASPRT